MSDDLVLFYTKRGDKMPIVTFSVDFEASKEKDDKKLQFNTRNTIVWDLECESRGLDREFGYQSFAIAFEQNLDIGESLKSTYIWVEILLPCLTIFGFCTGGFAAVLPVAGVCSVCGFGCLRLFAIIFAWTMMADLVTIGETTEKNLSVLGESVLNDHDCTDALSKIDKSVVYDQMEESSSSVSAAKGILSLIFIWIGLEICCPITISAISSGACSCCSKDCVTNCCTKCCDSCKSEKCQFAIQEVSKFLRSYESLN